MKENRATFPLAAMCRVLGLSPSGYYDWLTRPPSDRARRDIELQGKILLSWGGSGETYGCPRIQAELQAAGERVSRKRVARLMRDLGIQGVTRRRFKTATTRKDAKARPAPDLVNRYFSADGPDQLWVADITHDAHLGWLAVPRGRAGCLEPPHRGLGDGSAHAGRTCRGRAGDGDLEPEHRAFAKEQVRACPFAVVPPAVEQRAIAAVLSDVDELIGSLEALIAKKRAIKQAAMQQLLTGRTRLPGFVGEWETRRLGDLGVFCKGKGIRRDELRETGVRCVRLRGALHPIRQLRGQARIPDPKGNCRYSLTDQEW